LVAGPLALWKKQDQDERPSERHQEKPLTAAGDVIFFF
jgi:hypothetical protein